MSNNNEETNVVTNNTANEVVEKTVEEKINMNEEINKAEKSEKNEKKEVKNKKNFKIKNKNDKNMNIADEEKKMNHERNKQMRALRSVISLWKLEVLNDENKIFKENVVFDYDEETETVKIYCVKVGALIGVGGKFIKDLSDRIKNAKINGISNKFKRIDVKEIKNYV